MRENCKSKEMYETAGISTQKEIEEEERHT